MISRSGSSTMLNSSAITKTGASESSAASAVSRCAKPWRSVVSRLMPREIEMANALIAPLRANRASPVPTMARPWRTGIRSSAVTES